MQYLLDRMVGPCCHGDMAGHADGGGRLGSGTAGRRAEIKCDCDSGERRIKQRAIRD